MSGLAEIFKYAEEHSTPELPILNKIYRETNIRYLNPRMVSGHIQGAMLSILSKMVQPTHILEIGTFTGYSAICLAQGLRSGGKVHTIEIKDEIAEVANQYFIEAGLVEKIMLHIGNAIEVVPAINLTFDIIYIDGEKREYTEYYYTCINFLKTGGYLIADNVLWDGKVLNISSNNEASTKSVMEFNDLINNNPNLENLLLPIRDGLMIARKLY
jgi:predicted O-methyltransferase YrrM